jgi:hypothetical protein
MGAMSLYIPGHFLRIRQWVGGHLQKGSILYRVWRNDRWFVGNKKFGVVSHLIVGGGGGGAPGGLGGLWPPNYIVKKCPELCALEKPSTRSH